MQKKSENTVVVVKYNNSFDIFQSLYTGVVQVRGSITSEVGNILVFNNTQDGTYTVGGIVVGSRSEVSTKVEWFNTTDTDYKFEHRIKGITPLKTFKKEGFETLFPNSRTQEKGKPSGISFHHKISLTDEQLEILLK